MGLVNRKIVIFNSRITESEENNELKALQKLNDQINKAIEKAKKGEPLSAEIKELLKSNGLGSLIGESLKRYKKVNDGSVSRYKVLTEGSKKNRIQMDEVTDAVENMEPFVANSCRGVIERMEKKDWYVVYAYRNIMLLKQEVENPRNYEIFEPKLRNSTVDEIIKYIKIALGEWEGDE